MPHHQGLAGQADKMYERGTNGARTGGVPLRGVGPDDPAQPTAGENSPTEHVFPPIDYPTM
ncbi:hypothetical protein FM114_06740 [Luteococcus japonicus LSP_Lj1]|uniref:Uncharacterized protein n=1 Tax=Luteococcus japonicus LSP_Lj1 TaxID=1255658 RepID=A0A1R4JC50_9ACTN|nr:hypothetical protein FM114_06740 [Luteococcus japonicus LSP_Lj1]